MIQTPIPVPEVKENPTDEEVDVLHEILLKNMADLFDRYKDSYGWADKKLVIL